MAFSLQPGGWDLGTTGKLACEQYNEEDLRGERAMGWSLHWGCVAGWAAGVRRLSLLCLCLRPCGTQLTGAPG